MSRFFALTTQLLDGWAGVRAADPISLTGFDRIHRSSIDSPSTIREIFEAARTSKAVLDNGFDGASRRRLATVLEVSLDRLLLAPKNIGAARQLCFNFEVDSRRFFFAAVALGSDPSGLRIELPETLYEMERRDSSRASPHTSHSHSARRVEIALGERSVSAEVADSSYEGLGILCPGNASEARVNATLGVRFLDGSRAGEHAVGVVKYRQEASPGWTRLGLRVTRVSKGGQIDFERRRRIVSGGGSGWRALHEARVAGMAAGMAHSRIRERVTPSTPPALDLVEYENQKGEIMRGLVDTTESGPGELAIVIPPAWGRTKETLLPLARTLVATYQQAGLELTVLRFDGTSRRGESFVSPQFRAPGEEYLGFQFSQAAADIHATVSFLKDHPVLSPTKVILLTVSIGSVEGRRAMATDPTGLLQGWIALVGIADLRSCLRVASGGIDYARGLESGVNFGKQELTGVLVDMDVTGPDAMRHDLAYFDDARNDIANISAPITWIHGRHDGWIELDRVKELLAAGGTRGRRLIEIPSGHQLRSSREALEVFQLVAVEAVRMSEQRLVRPGYPSAADLASRRRAERLRLPSRDFSARDFWSDYLLGRKRLGGIQLMAATTAYKQLMAEQIALLEHQPSDRILDLGAGTCELARELPARTASRVLAIDLVGEALVWAQRYLSGFGRSPSALVADLACPLPLEDESVDRILASLLLSYLRSPDSLLREAFRVVRSGGIVVASSLRRDADNSMLYRNARAELHPARLRSLLGHQMSEEEANEVARDFMNDNARIFSLEEEGIFSFWDLDELRELLESTGFVVEAARYSFGNPPQVAVVSGRRP